jgi:hypothetical protein
MTLGELRPGAVFRTDDGRIGVLALWWGADGRPSCLWVDGRGSAPVLPGDTPVEPLDLPALLKERDELLGLTHDLLIDSAAFERGREAERGEVARLLEAAHAEHTEDVEGGHNAWVEGFAAGALADVLSAVRARGPAATPLPPARLAERARELEGALRGLVNAISGSAHDVAYYAHALAAARAALTGAGGKQPT